MTILSGLSSKNRWIHIETPLGGDAFMVDRINGTESLGRLFEYEVIALSKDGNVNFDDLLGHHATVSLETRVPGRQKHIDGRVAQIGLVGMSGRLFKYRLVLRPWLWMLTRTADCKIFQEKDVHDIVEEVFADQPDADYEFQLSEYYHPKTYCVQYRETDFAFVSRLLEEAGIYYFFKHEKGKHTMVICDAVSAHESIGTFEFQPQGRPPRSGMEYVAEWTVTKQIQPGKTATRDYNFETPTTEMLGQAIIEHQHSESEHEIFDYPGEYLEPAEGEIIARTRLEEIQVAQEVTEGRSDIREFSCGALFELANFGRSDQNREYLLLSCHIVAQNNLPEAIDGQARLPSFDCWFKVLPSAYPFRPARLTPIPTVKGPQTAEVVGPSGEEIHVDEYGRVKVQFHWDRYGEKDDQSSCWMRVSQMWAGKNYGWMTIPRIGQEVIVSFLEGDPDQPVITGRVYNADQMPPWELPANKTQSGILTRSSSDGSPSTANQLKFEDKKGEEQIYIHAEKNKDTHVENNDSTFVGNDQFLKVHNDQWVTIENDQWIKVEKNRNVQVLEREDYSVAHGHVSEVGDFHHLKVNGDQEIFIDGFRKEEVTGTLDSKVTGGNRTEDTTAGNESRTISGDQTFVVSGDIGYGATKITLAASGDLNLNSAANAFMMGQKCSVISNTDIDLMSMANINQVSVGNNTTVMGSNASGYMGMASDFFAGMSTSTSLSMAMGTFVGMSLETKLAISLDTVIGATLSTHIGPRLEMVSSPALEMAPFKIMSAGGGGGGGGGGSPPASMLDTVIRALVAANSAGATGLSAYNDISNTAEQYEDAQSQLGQAAEAAANAGHAALAARLSNLAGETTFLNQANPFHSDASLGAEGENTGMNQSNDQVDAPPAQATSLGGGKGSGSGGAPKGSGGGKGSGSAQNGTDIVDGDDDPENGFQ